MNRSQAICGIASWVGRAPALLLFLVVLGFVGFLRSAVQAQTAPVIPKLGIPAPELDPSGRSGDLPSLQKPTPKAAPAPGLILPPILPSKPESPEQLPTLRALIRKIDIKGSTVLKPEELAKITGPYEGRELSYEDLEAVRVAITATYVNKGYINSGAIIPDQTIQDGVVTLQVIEGTLNKIHLEGNGWFWNSYIRDRLRLGISQPFDINKLQERMQLLLQDRRFEKLNADLRPGLRLGESELNVKVEEAFPFRLRFEYNNFQSPSVGSHRGQVTFESLNVLGLGDTLSVQHGGSRGIYPQLDIRYTIPINKYDTTLGFNYRKNQSIVVEDPFDAVDVQNKSEIFGFTLRHPVYRTVDQEFSIELSAERLENRTFLLGEPFSFSLGVEDGKSVVSALRFAQEWIGRSESQVIAARSRFSFGVDALGSTIHPNSKLPDSHFFAWLGQFQWAKRWPFLGIESLLRTDVQLSNDSLFSIEQIAVGGRYSVRGYRENTLIRDSAAISSLELRFPIVMDQPWADYIQLAPFYDIGHGWNTKLETPRPRTLHSVGIGLRWATTLRTPVPVRPQFEVYWGHPLKKVVTKGGNLQDHGLHMQFILSVF